MQAQTIEDSDLKISKLKVVAEKHPKYARAMNIIATTYSSKKMYYEAITWYQKGLEAIPEYDSCDRSIGTCYKRMGRIDDAMHWYFKADEKDKECSEYHELLLDIFKQKQLKE